MIRIATRITLSAACVAVAALAFSPVSAQAQKKMTREQAWSQCLDAVGQKTSSAPEASTARVAAFKACMAKLGYKP